MDQVAGRATGQASRRRPDAGAATTSGPPQVRRALRTSAAVLAGGARVWPHWLQRQLDPASAAFVTTGVLPLVANVTGRTWTVVGNVGSEHQAVVDPRGLVTPWPDGWSLDWWVGAEDRWHLPSREAAVRQRLVGDAPVVETAMRIPGGDVLQRVYAVRAAARDGGGELVVVEVENATPVPVALAVALRPYNTEGVATIGRITVDSPATVSVDGQVALRLPRQPNRAAAAAFDDGDVATVVLAGQAGTSMPGEVHCGRGMASAAFVYPLPHRATMSFLLPLAPPAPVARRGRSLPAAAVPTTATAIPTGAQVANGWRAHAGAGMRLVLPDVRLTAAVEANRRSLLLLHDRHGDAVEARPFPFRSVAAELGALGRYGHGDEVAAVLASYPARQRRDGSFPGPVSAQEAVGAAISAIAEHWRLTRDLSTIDGAEPVLAAAAEWTDRRLRGAHRRRRSTIDHPGADHADGLWAVRGLLDAAEVLAALDEGAAAVAAGRRAAEVRTDVEAVLGADAPAGGSTPGGTVDAAVAGALLAARPLRLLGADDPRVVVAADTVRAHHCHGPACTGSAAGAGLDTERTLLLASLELEAGDRRALDRLDWLLSVASPTWTWPEVLHPRLDTGCAGDGHHGGTVAALLHLVRDLLVRETGDGGLALCSLVPADWLGQPVEVHDAPTHHGRLSYAIRWHGERPALLWELDPHDGATAVRITAPGLDPSWSTTELRGDALLAPVPPPAGVGDGPGEDEPGAGGASADGPPAEGPLPVTPVRLSPRRPRPS